MRDWMRGWVREWRPWLAVACGLAEQTADAYDLAVAAVDIVIGKHSRTHDTRGSLSNRFHTFPAMLFKSRY